MRPTPILLLAAGLATFANAQADARTQQKPRRTITVQNLAPFPRQEWTSAVVPFAKAEVPAGTLPALHLRGRPTVWQPLGARWQDGSLRQALCLFRARVPALGELKLPLLAGPPAPRPATALLLPPKMLAITVRQGDRVTTATPEPVRLYEHNAARTIALFRCRVGKTGLLFEVLLTCYAGQLTCDVDLALFFSDPRTKAMQCSLDQVTVTAAGYALELRHAGLFAIQHQRGKSATRIVLLKDAVLGDGQGIRRTGVLVPPLTGKGGIVDQSLRAAVVCPLLAATRWSESGAFGPFGLVPKPPPWLRGPALRAALARRHRTFAAASRGPGDPFANLPFGLARMAGQTGEQADFGVLKLAVVASSGLPSFLLEVEPSVLQEACRPVHFFEADGHRVRARLHPDWIVWSGRTHWHCRVSKDRLGKPCPEPRFESHGWTGKDRQHWSSNYLAAFYLLTGRPWARRELENEVELYLAGQTISRRYTTSGPGAPRGAGRTMLAACWLYLCTGNQALLQRMNERVEKVHYPSWFGRKLAKNRMRTFQVHAPDARILKGKTAYWTPWEDSLAAIGFFAFWRLTGNQHARELAEGLAETIVRHGWRLGAGQAIIATAIRWQDGGVPPKPDELDDQNKVLWSFGTAFSQWCIGAVEIARQYGVRKGDQELRRRAETILARVRKTRARPANGWYDRLTEWDAVR